MPLSNNTKDLGGRQMIVEPEYGYGWLLVGKTLEPIVIEVPKPFECTISDVLLVSEVGHGLTAHCDVEISGYRFFWVGFIPRTDSFVDLAATEVFASLVLSPTIPILTNQDLHSELKYFRTESKIFIRGSSRLCLKEVP